MSCLPEDGSARVPDHKGHVAFNDLVGGDKGPAALQRLPILLPAGSVDSVINSEAASQWLSEKSVH